MHITADQMKTLGEAMRRRFEIDSIAMLRRTYPESTARHDDALMHHFVRYGIERAEVARLDAVTDIERWLRLMMRLGPYFDTDPKLGSIRVVLGKIEIYGPLRLDEVEALAERFAPEPD
jgi:hypothetical protein